MCIWFVNVSKITLFTTAFINKLPYILESNPHPFYSFRGLKEIRCGLESRVDWIGGRELDFGKMIRAAVPAVRTIQYNNLFYFLFILYNI